MVIRCCERIMLIGMINFIFFWYLYFNIDVDIVPAFWGRMFLSIMKEAGICVGE